MIKSFKQIGFTLIELLLVLSVIAILMLVAVPGYQKYVWFHWQTKLKQDMLNLSGQLQIWQSRSLTYAGFIPKNGYDDALKNQIHSPRAKQDIKYHITLSTVVDDKPVKLTDADVATNWVMIATPVSQEKKLPYYAITSNGTRCMSINKLEAYSVWKKSNCGSNSETW